MSQNRKVLLIKEGIYADLISEGVHASRISYTYGGILYNVVVENDEFEIIEDYWEEPEE